MKLSVLNAEGKEVASREVLAGWERRAVVPALLHQAVVTAAGNRRRATAHTKTRGEVRGGGRKPWRQKGTGRARHGSIRSPLWKGGGTTFGPSADRDYARRLPAAMRRAALAMALAGKWRDGEVALLERWPEVTKTKDAARLFAALQRSGSRVVVVPRGEYRAVVQVSRNLPGTTVRAAEDLTAADALAARHLVVSTAAWDILERRLGHSEQASGVKGLGDPARLRHS